MTHRSPSGTRGSMRAVLSAFCAALLCAAAVYAADEKKTQPRHENRVDYLDPAPGADFAQFAAAYKGMGEKLTGNFLEMEKRAKTDFTFTLKRPKGFDGFERFIRQIPVRIMAAPQGDGCGKPVDAVFLGVPRQKEMRELLFAYSFMTCSDEPMVTPARFMDKYIEKYGLYDGKDFDRGQHIYYNVRERFEVRVKPLAGPGGKAALVITVSDGAVFTEAYKAWRARLRQAEETSREKF